MKRCAVWLAGALIIITPTGSFAQPWAGILSASRAVDWTGAGVVGGIPSRTTICATLNPGATATQINSAIDACPAGQVVFLSAGTYNLSSGIEVDKNNVTLRGAGANATILKISGTVGGCHIGSNRVVQMCTNNGGNIGVDSAEHTANWTAGYAKGSTAITLSDVTGLQVGSTLWLDQLDDTSDGWPAAGDTYMCDNGAPNCANNGTGEAFARDNRGVLEGHIVTAISGNNVTITPGVMFPTFRSARTPGAWWGNSSTILTGAGLEHLTIDATPSSNDGIAIINATNSWVKGVRVIRSDTTTAAVNLISLINAVHVSVVDGYYYGPLTTQLVSTYGLTSGPMSLTLIQNNIFHTNSSPIVMNSPFYGNVVAYNYFEAASQASVILHGIGGMNLYEGNNGRNFSGDTIHSSHGFETLFRNHWDRGAHNPTTGESISGFALYANNRFFNLIGNVVGNSGWTIYAVNQTHNEAAIYETGWQGTGSGTTIPNDANVLRTLMRWGNWDSVTSTNDNGTNDSTGTRFVASEVPSGITNFLNPVPASQTLPPSLYLSAKPSWFGSGVWPPIGPDVSNGDITTATGGHAYKIPARLCFENTATDSAYGGTVKRFNAIACYGSSGTSAPASPSNLRIIP